MVGPDLRTRPVCLLQCNPTPLPFYRTSCGTWHSGKVCPKVLCVSALPCPDLGSSLHGFSTCLCESTRIQYPSIWINTHYSLFVNGPVTELLGSDGERWNQWTLWGSGGLGFYRRFSPGGPFFLACGSGLKMVCCFHDALKTHLYINWAFKRIQYYYNNIIYSHNFLSFWGGNNTFYLPKTNTWLDFGK